MVAGQQQVATGQGNWSRVTGAERAVASMEAEYTMLLPGRPDP